MIGDQFFFRRHFAFFPAHKPLYGEDCLLRIYDRLVLGYYAKEPFTVFSKTGEAIPLSSVARITEKRGFARIGRINHQF